MSNPGFETKAILVTIGTTGAPVPLRIPLVVGAVSTTINVQGREDDLIGIAESGTQGTVGATEIQDRPILRSGEVLETVPGLIITQHAGGGKANQYFLRGFNLDHGTDIAIFLDDMPLNLPSHAHGEGYSDMNTVIPEFVQRVNFEKGPYYADVGNFSSAANRPMWNFSRRCPRTSSRWKAARIPMGGPSSAHRKSSVRAICCTAEKSITMTAHGCIRMLITKSTASLTYSQGDDANGASITARAYHGKWNSSDQIPVAAQPLVGFFGTLNPSDGGHSQRYSLQGEWHRQDANSESKILAYVFYYDLDLFSDFTYYLVDYNKGDQFEQQDRRWVGGLDAHHTIFSTWSGRKMSNTFGLQFRNDWINNGLYRTENRVRTTKTDYSATAAVQFLPRRRNRSSQRQCSSHLHQANPNSNITLSVTLPNNLAFANNGSTATSTTVPNTTCPTLPATTERDNFTDMIGSAYVENKIQWANKFRSVVALRGDDEKFVVTSLAYPTNITLPDGYHRHH